MPTFDTGAEQLALAGALASPADFDHVRRRLTPDDFTAESARLTYMAMLALHEHGIRPTKSTLFDQLERMGHPGALGYLATLDGNAVPGTAAHYVDKVLVATRSRRYLTAAQRLQQLAALHPTDDVDAEERDAEVLDLTLALAQDIEQGDRVLPDAAQLRHQHAVSAEVARTRVRDDARRYLAREHAGNQQAPDITLGAQFLAEPDDPVSYRVDQLWPTGGRVLLAAQYKAGKTTLVGNLVRSLADATPFLGTFPITRQARRVLLLDNELAPNMVRAWLRQQDIHRDDGYAVLAMRGHLSTFDILDGQTRAEWARKFRDAGIDVFVLDCLRPLMDALGLDENRDAGRILTAIDELLGLAGIPEAVVVHHMGHTAERSRGDSRLRDWPDVEWRLLREDPEDPASPRYFTAFGRDVDIPESSITYDISARRLTMATGSRKDAAAHKTLPAVLDLLAEQDGLSGRQIEEALMADGHRQKTIRAAISVGVNTDKILTYMGPRRATIHSLKAPKLL
jgi:hypothetical protein